MKILLELPPWQHPNLQNDVECPYIFLGLFIICQPSPFGPRWSYLKTLRYATKTYPQLLAILVLIEDQ